MSRSQGASSALMVGLIADTHGLLRAEALAALGGADLIVHAGDVGRAGILEALGRLAPVCAVRGNVDRGAWAAELPPDARLEVGGLGIYVYHGHEKPALEPVAAGFRVVVRGHSHKHEVAEQEGVLYLNPGSAGSRRFRLPVTLMRLYIGGAGVRTELVELGR